jgi:hypothetical protein
VTRSIGVRLVNGDETGEYVRMKEARRRGRRREEGKRGGG